MTAFVVVACAIAAAGCDRHELNTERPKTETVAVQPNRPPIAPSIEPPAGIGTRSTFTIRLSDPDGLEDLAWGQVIFNDDVSGTTACYVHWEHAAAALHLMNDAADALLGPREPGASGVLENAQCRIDVGAVTVAQSADAVTLRVPIEFKPAFRGAQEVRVRAADREGHTLDWASAGKWEVR